MNEMLTVLSLSFSGGLLILVLVFLRPFFKRRFSKQWQYYIWLIVIARLLFPFAPQTNLVNVLVQKADRETGHTEYIRQENQQKPDSTSQDDISSDKIEKEQSSLSEKQTTAGFIPYFVHSFPAVIWENLWLGWLAIALILFIRKITIYQSFVKYVRAGCADVEDINVLERFGVLVEQSRIKNTVELSVNSLVSSPLLVGFLHPRIILPSASLSDSDFRYTIMHELTHYRRKDMFYKWLVQLAVCVHWFHPLVYLMEREINRACELSCDEAVIKMLDMQGRRAYGDTLLNAMGTGGSYRDSLASITLNESKELLKERLDAVMGFQKKSGLAIIMTAILTIVIVLGASFSGVYAAGSNSSDKQPESVSKGHDGASENISDVNYETDSLQIDNLVLYENGEYFIFFDGADEDDMPGSTGPDFGVTFCAVWKDGCISFDSYHVSHKLTKKVSKACKWFVDRERLTKNEAEVIIAVAAKVQSGDTSEFGFTKKMEEYAAWGIEKKNGNYYYKDKRIGVLNEVREDGSFMMSYWDKKGKIGLQIVRNDENEIKKVKRLSKKQMAEITEKLYKG